MLDYPACYHGYIIDQTRILALGGLPRPLAEAYQASCDILAQLAADVKAGTSCGEVHAMAKRLAAQTPYGDNLMRNGDYEVPFIGHGVGLELDEPPVLAVGNDQPLQAGMVIAIEPKFIFPAQGVVGVENTYLVRTDGLEALSITSPDLMVV